MLANQPRIAPRYPIGFYPPIPLSDVAWKLRWPTVLSSIIAISMIIFTIIIAALEIASLAISTSKSYGNTASIGTGLWCSPFFLLAGVLILMIARMRRTRLWATYGFFAAIIAACFSIILLGLDAKAVKDGNYFATLTGTFLPKYRVLAAQLAFACFEFLLCCLFIIIYVIVLMSVPRNLR